MDNIRNFVITAHIDHGKSTLADRLLEVTGTVEARRMRAQYLDQLDLERERGITIKMAPVRMKYKSGGKDYILNLIDTPGHSDFSYEVSRALAAVEGAILLVDVTKGIQAQTLSNFRAAKKAGLTIVGAVNKIDVGSPNTEEIIAALAALIETEPQEIFRISAKTGDGVRELLEAVIQKVPPPVARQTGPETRALIFDSLYDDHRGILAYMRVFDGSIGAGDAAHLFATKAEFKIKESGHFLPQLTAAKRLHAGEIGYIATGLKEPEKVKIGDTVIKLQDGDAKGGPAAEPLAGYREPAPVVFISFYPDGATKFDDLKKGLDRLRLTDAALRIEPDANEALGRGLKVGFLGQLHFDIIATRLKREFDLEFLTSFPSIAYRVQVKGQSRVVKEPHEFPADAEKVWEPVIALEIITPPQYMQGVLGLQNVFSLQIGEMVTVGGSLVLKATMPLSELIRDFDDQLKSISAGFASFSYELTGEQETDSEKLEILVAGEVVSALTRIVAKKDVEREARQTAERLKELLPRAQFAQAIQARVQGRIIARETLPPMKKDVTGYLYGGDRTRKMKLWKKQKRGKERLKDMAKVNVPVEVFREILKK
ncbi:MAG: elongation factor 4 [Candidatus Liptonbacteria bacterium RIFCSPHIGHO2_01_FULL_57_28]|uniref:Elongation factor 4 n=1 Tax=Candidatus Liptonbacteria bacterium RIFCSPHIGHO2_01_FULL_57_28 TaxID=1798647 RepID=A0A1G2CCM4_9BACT|nr:MAG: elongation factor 4 [Candidatus Liptonbacteria bacterium RIFCSPHIGHO2_01_FULL_57_28]